MDGRPTFRVICIAYLVLSVVYLPRPSAAGEKVQRLCRYDDKLQQCVDIGSRPRHRRKKCSLKHDGVAKAGRINTDIDIASFPYIQTGHEDVDLSSESDVLGVVASGKCDAQDGVCDIREVDAKMRCRCWADSGDVVSTGERLCRRRSGECLDVAFGRDRRKGQRKGRKWIGKQAGKRNGKRKVDKRNGKGKVSKRNGARKGLKGNKERIGRNKNKERKDRSRRRRRHGARRGRHGTRTGRTHYHRVASGRKGRCATRKAGGECKNIENQGRSTDRKCECIPSNIYH